MVFSSFQLSKAKKFIDGKLRGIGTVQFNRDINKHLVFLTVYSNIAVGETVTFRIWDASACLLFGNTIETFPFEADGLVGSPLVPQIIYTNNQVLRKIYIHPGWNWISYNLNLTNPEINQALSSLTNPGGALIKTQVPFSAYSLNTNSWIGTLNSLTHMTMYQYNSLTYDSISILGAPVDPSTPIPLVGGWNWLGYLPQYGLPLTPALQSLSPLNGDIIKGQLSFAQYVAGIGWIGNLNFLSSPNGYLIKLSNPGVLQYPANSGAIISDRNSDIERNPLSFKEFKHTEIDRIKEAERPFDYWSVTPQNYEYSMNAIAVVVNNNDERILHDGDEVGAFVGDQIRGSGTALYIPALDAHMIFLTIYANTEGELLRFKIFDASENKVIDLMESTGFKINSIWGQVDSPQLLHLPGSTGLDDQSGKANSLVVYPNPAGYYVYINFTAALNDDVTITITDALGKEVKRMENHVQYGHNVIEWKPDMDLSNGIYYVILKGANGVHTSKIELLR